MHCEVPGVDEMLSKRFPLKWYKYEIFIATPDDVCREGLIEITKLLFQKVSKKLSTHAQVGVEHQIFVVKFII